MTIPALQRHACRFEERNDFVYALLGLVASSRAIERIPGQAPTATEMSAANNQQESPCGSAGDELVADALLGVLALQMTCSQLVEEWAEQVDEPPPAAPSQLTIGELLR